jgi:cytochrome c biogenesis protein CcmG/thiol:disulfide interchange protein DsbE
MLCGLGLAALSFAQEVPRQSPEFAAKLPDGQQLLLSQYRGKVVGLVFIHTTCPHCQETSQVLEKLYKEYGPKGFQPIAVAFDEYAMMRVPQFKSQLGITFPVAVAGYDEVQNYLQTPVRFVPDMVFIDRKGVIRAQYAGESDFFRNQEPNIRSEITKLLNNPEAQKTRGLTKKSKPGAKTASETASRKLE